LFQHGPLKPFVRERVRTIEALHAGKSRAEALREVIEMEDFKRREGERALVLLQLLLQLRRDVAYGDSRYQPWLDKLDASEPVAARHVLCLVLTSEEYQRRFGSVVSHNNDECR